MYGHILLQFEKCTNLQMEGGFMVFLALKGSIGIDYGVH